MVEELLKKYDLYHTSVISGGKIKFNINYLPEGDIYISLVALINDEEIKHSFDILDDDDFRKFYLPKILQVYFSKNVKVQIRKIMGNSNQGTIIVQRNDLKDSLIIRNCSTTTMDLVDLIHDCFSYMSNYRVDSMVSFDDKYGQYDDYVEYNIIFDYAKYKKQLYKDINVISQDDLLILNIARYAYSFEELNKEDVWEEVKKNFDGNEKVMNICDVFKANNYSEENVYHKALCLAEYEKNNDMLIQSNEILVDEAYKACDENINFFDNSYIDYWSNKINECEEAKDDNLMSICKNFLDSRDLYSNVTYISKDNDDNVLVSKIKETSEDKNTFSSIINDPISEEDLVEDEVERIFSTLDRDQIKVDAEEQARRIIQLEKERDELKNAADEYARIILKNAKDYKMIEESSRIQALRILELEKQNISLKRMAEENARHIFEKEKIYQEEAEARKESVEEPVKSQDIDKINNLLYAISSVKNLDFSVNHPTTMQELSFLEEKIVTYLTTHKNIVHEEDVIVPIEKQEMLETKPVIELLAMIRNAYTSSHNFEKDGRHTLINFNPVDEDTFKVSLYSIKEDEEDLLMDAYFEQYQLSEKVLEELCDIFKDGAVVVASKTDNIPPDKADFLAIDNMSNAIKFMGCNRTIIDKVKEYI